MTLANAKKKFIAHREALAVAALSVVAVVYTHRRAMDDPERWSSVRPIDGHGIEITRHDGKKFHIQDFCRS